MRRRRILGALVAVILGPLAASAQLPTKVSRIGCLWAGSASAFSSRLHAFREGLRQLGYREGQTVALECRFAEGKFDRLPGLAAEVVDLKPNVILTAGDISISAARQPTSAIPIVVANSGDLIGPGHVASLARPGGNVTEQAIKFDLAIDLKTAKMLSDDPALAGAAGGSGNRVRPSSVTR